MDAAAAALADLIEISSQVEAVVLLAADGSVLASTVGDDLRAKRFAEAAKRLFDAAVESEAEIGSPPLQQLEAATLGGSVFVVRDGERMIAAVTSPEPTVGLVFYDLKTALRQGAQTQAGEPQAGQADKPNPRQSRKKPDSAAPAEATEEAQHAPS
jgi:predicted regulator of Ras-like GTPase activity (Roadblock/LC7/MglB family)